MDLQNIQEQLNTEFAKSGTRIIFWFDDKGDYEEEVAELLLPEATLHVLNQKNWFYTKWLLNEHNPEGKYLIYAPFPKPSDNENPLADIYYYSVPYYTDRISQMCQEIGIESKFKEHLAMYTNFWKNKHRIERFKELGIDKYTIESIDIGLIAVLADVKTPNMDEVVRQVIFSDSSTFMKALDNNGLTEVFWNLCEKNFGYKSSNPNLSDLATCLLITYSSVSLKSSLPSTFGDYVLGKKEKEGGEKVKFARNITDIIVFVKNVMDNVMYQEKYNLLADTVDKTLRFGKKIASDLQKDKSKHDDIGKMEDIIACDTFACFDEIIIEWLLEKLQYELLDEKLSDMNIAEICRQRVSKAFHFGARYEGQYLIIEYAYLLMKKVKELNFAVTFSDFMKQYMAEYYVIDSYYRWFYYYFDRIEATESFEGLRVKIENIYINVYLQQIVPKWNELLTEEQYSNSGMVRQEDFFQHYLRPYDGKERVVVIISDALRYECAMELMNELEMDEKCNAKMTSMLGVLPSVTSVGMASLLPHKELSVDQNVNVLVDGSPCGDLATRDKILKQRNESNLCISFDEVARPGREASKPLKGRNIVYIYHNQVDARGDKPASENEVFNACKEAIVEIHALIRKLTTDVSATRFFITADHGFLYKRDRLQESDKVSYPKDSCSCSNKRYLMMTQKVEVQGATQRTMEYLKSSNELYVVTPNGADIFKVPGSGQNYVHGGSSPQEMVIPVIEVRTEKKKVNTDFVEVVLTSVTRKVTNLITYFDFIQTEKVTEVMKPRSILAYFTADSETGEKISFDVPIMANSREDAADKRTFREKFTLKTREYKRDDKYYLVLVDEKDPKNILQSYEFMIDIAFVNDFGF